jgi:hypothetical protein
MFSNLSPSTGLLIVSLLIALCMFGVTVYVEQQEEISYQQANKAVHSLRQASP